MIILLAGLPGTGKTTLVRELAARSGGRVLSKDDIRHSLFTAEEIEYSSRQDDLVMEIMLEAAGFLIRQNRNCFIFLDGRPFSRRYQIDNVLNAAISLHQPWRILECVCSEELARDRLDAQIRGNEHAAANRDFQLYLAVKERFEEITAPKTVIDTNQPLDVCVQTALSVLR